MRPTQPIQLKSDAELGTLLAALAEDTVTASIHWRLYKDLMESAPEFLKELNQSAAFWTLTRDAHRDIALIRLARLYDDQNRALSLLSLLDTVRANLHLFDEPRLRERLKGNQYVDNLATGALHPDSKMLDEDIRSVSALDARVKRLAALRNRVLAHRDSTVVLGITKDPLGSLDLEDVDTLRDRADAIVNRYSILYRAGSYRMEIVGQQDFKQVLRAVRKDMAVRERRIAREVKRATRG
jgi:hypothetical protein